MADDPPAPKLDPPFLACVDMSAFSQSELRTLCAISNARLKLSNSGDVVVPQINPAVFNASAAGRKQTYSPRRSPSSVGHFRRFSSLVVPAEPPADDDESLRERKLIVGLFKQYMQNPGGNVEVPDTSENLGGGGGNGVQIANKDGATVDLRKPEVASDPYGGELMRRTAGMERKEELLGFLKGLDGEWCSRRKKRKIVDATLLGDALPVGWKIIIALKRQAGRFSPFCRRYISPTGEHLPSCKEVAAYLSSHFASSEMNLTNKVCVEGQGVGSVKDTSTNLVDFPFTQDISNPTKLPSSLPVVYEEAAASGVGNLCDVKVHDFFECYKCKVKFSEKDAYDKHLLSSHENTPKRYRMGSPIGKGVIFRDGKYECQFCHKVFENKKRYSGHVGVHVRNFNRGSKELYEADAIKCTEESSVDKMPSDLSKMDALVSVAPSSTEALPGFVVSEKPLDADNLAVNSNSTIDSSKLEMEKTGETVKNVIEVPSTVGGITQILVGNKEMYIDDHQRSVYVGESSIIPSNEEIQNARTSKRSESHHEDGLAAAAANTPSLSSFKASLVGLEKESASFTEVKSGCTSPTTPPQNFSSDHASPKGIESSFGTWEGHASPFTALQKTSSSFKGTKKGGENMSDADAEQQGVVDLDDLMLEDPESGNHNTMVDSGPIFPGEDPKTLDCMAGSNAAPQPFRTVCVWCGTSFYPEVAVTEEESDSVGYMCTICRTKISKQISELERSWAKTSTFL